MRRFPSLFPVGILLATAGILLLSPGGAPGKAAIRYVGSSTVGKFIEEAAKVYPDAQFAINTKPESGGGETATAAGKTDLGGVAREVKEKILKAGVKKHLIGRDAIGVWVNRENPVRSLTQEQLKGIFTGKIANWREVGGPDQPIHVYVVNPQSATRKVFQKVILGKAKYAGKNLKTVRPDTGILDKVGADPQAIGQLSFALAVGHPAEAQVKKVAIGDQAASVTNPDYPITRPLYLITKGEPVGPVADFIAWARSEGGQSIVKKYFVGVR